MTERMWVAKCEKCGKVFDPSSDEALCGYHVRCGPSGESQITERVLVDEAESRKMLIVAFVQGAKWWEFHSTGGTMWQSDQSSANAEATRKANAGTLGVDPIRALADAPREEK